MGNGILSRAGSGDGYKVGDVILSAKSSLGEKWALCNGDPVTGGGISPELIEKLGADPMNDSSWQQIMFTNIYDKLLYDDVNDVYYGIKTSTTSKHHVQIYRLTADSETLLATKSFTIYDTPAYSSAALCTHRNSIIIVAYGYGVDGTTYARTVLSEYSIDTNSFSTTNYRMMDANGINLELDYSCAPGNGIEMYIINNILIINHTDGVLYDILIYNLDNIATNMTPFCSYTLENMEDYEDSSDTHSFEFMLISVTQSKNYIIMLVSEIDTVAYDDLTDTDTESMGRVRVLMHVKGSSVINTVFETYFNNGSGSYDYDYESHFPHAVSCYDYENDKFIINMNSDGTLPGVIHDIDMNNFSGRQSKNTGRYRELYRVITISDKLYTLLLRDTDIYIREGFDWATLTDLSKYTLLNNVACESYYTDHTIYEGWNQLCNEHKTLIFKISTGFNTGYKYYGLAGGACLPTINKDGVNGFIKIKN